jgi:hypothetical protein
MYKHQCECNGDVHVSIAIGVYANPKIVYLIHF